MESLGLMVAVLMALVLFTGPISLLLTSNLLWNSTASNKALRVIRRSLLVFFTLIGMPVQFMILLTPISAMVKIFSLLGLALNITALKHEFIRNQSWSSLFKKDKRNPNGPDGQS